MIPFFPRQITNKAVLIYVIALTLVSVVFIKYAMAPWRMVLGMVFVSGFFFIASSWSQSRLDRSEKQFVQTLFLTAISLRILWVVASYFYYTKVTGIPFEVDAADSTGYHEEAIWLSSEPWSTAWGYYFGPFSSGISDVGYPLYLTVLYKLFGSGVMLPRIIKCFLSSWMCVMIYKLSSRTFGEQVGRMAGIMCCLMPNLII